MKNIFVIGNGESRKNFDLNLLKPYGLIIGCNAICREFDPDIVVCVDEKITDEVWGKYLNLDKTIIYTRYPWNPLMLPLSPDRGWSAGPTAVDIATHTHRNQINEDGNIFLLGFDLYGIDGKHNNIYKGTENYRGTDEQATHYGNWINQLAIVFSEHPYKKFYRVGRENDSMPEEWKAFDNIKFISYDEMWRRVK